MKEDDEKKPAEETQPECDFCLCKGMGEKAIPFYQLSFRALGRPPPILQLNMSNFIWPPASLAEKSKS
jgi:hypothetical protein